ncbi:long-chain-fatty-acid--CoA ligase [Siminovitchia terrae]|uniref:Long-chain-fatty-acid--CoA ligase n=1 Tax=Siminovitchia terrae TaxID=1914933 RepID=A0ABQ4L354_SIMTE|nr:AMP-binding protein [Siminovitchia terrae]GIN98306.1 long-chain-fatty-acid--CoA ligase [Siminovitchia terrae]
MQNLKKKSWPSYLPKQLDYKLGEKPLHEYLNYNAEKYPSCVPYNYYGNKITWAMLNDYTNRLAHFLKENHIKKGDRVALYMQNCPQYIIGYFGIQKIGAIVVPLNPMYKEAELDYFINEVDIKAVISTVDLYPRVYAIKDKTPTVEFIITTRYLDFLPEEIELPIPDELKIENQKIDSTYDFVTIMEQVSPLKEIEEIDIWNDVCLMSFTSGTTGRPKAAMLTYGNALFKAAATTNAFGFTKDDKTIIIPPLCHIGGKILGVNIPIYSCCESILMSRFDPEATIQAIEKYKINLLYTLPPMNVAILDYPNIEERDLSSLKINFATSFGIPVSKELAQKWRTLTNGCLLYEATYGLSETHDADTFMPRDNIKFGSVGIPTFETEMRIIDLDTGEELPTGKQGEIVIKSPGVFKGYYKRPEDTYEVLKNGRLHTGDIGSFDEDGYLFLHGRVKEMIKSSGYSVFPEDVEALLDRHEAILQVAVVGVPDEKRGQSVKAFVVLRQEYKGKIMEEDIIHWAKNNMSAYKYPRYVEFRDHLPEAISGKVLRKYLQEGEEKERL